MCFDFNDTGVENLLLPTSILSEVTCTFYCFSFPHQFLSLDPK